MNAAIRSVVLSTIVLSTLAIVGCEGAPRDDARREPATTPTSTPTSRVELGAEAAVLYQRALVRDPEPTCAALTAGLAQPTAALLEVVERTTAPPSAGMRAASCLVREHAAEIEPQMTSWVAHRATMGFGLVVLNDLDRLEPALADRLARAALAGEYADRARPRIARSERHGHLVSQPSAPGDVAPETVVAPGSLAPTEAH